MSLLDSFLPFINKKPIEIYADKDTSKFLIDTFSYCFKNNNKEYPAILKLNKIKNDLFVKKLNKKIKIKPITVRHGKVKSICYIIDQTLAYISDVNEIYKKDFKYFKNLEYLIIDCLWYRNHPSHFNLEKSLEIIKMFSPKRAILTNLHTDIDYDKIKKFLPNNVVPAYDGLTINL